MFQCTLNYNPDIKIDDIINKEIEDEKCQVLGKVKDASINKKHKIIYMDIDIDKSIFDGKKYKIFINEQKKIILSFFNQS
jgi:hypothetical protein